jgi:hypothetical protein
MKRMIDVSHAVNGKDNVQKNASGGIQAKLYFWSKFFQAVSC